MLAALCAATLVGLVGGDRARAAESTCPATFHVLHDDRVGKLKLAEGHYEITLLDDRSLSCEAASDLFRQFLEDWNGKLPGNWQVIPADSEFRKGSSEKGFRVKRVGNPSGGGGGGKHPASGRACPGFFHVLHDDRIGRLRLREGDYRITLLSTGRLSCRHASQLFTRFLEDWDGELPGRWRLDVKTGTFSRNAHYGFRVKRAHGSDGGGGGRHPGKGHERCPGTFRVLHDDRIGKLRLPAGRYKVTVFGGIGCSSAEKKLAAFLEDPSGDLPGRWRVNSDSATFRKGKSGKGFRIKLR